MTQIPQSKNIVKRHVRTQIDAFSGHTAKNLVEIIALLFVILFLYTGASKLLDFALFQEQLAESKLLEPMAPLIAWGLPIMEFVISLLLFIPQYRVHGLYAAFILMVLFTGYVASLLAFSKELPCSCGGILQALSWPGHLLLNVVLVGLALTGILLAKKIKMKGGVL